MNKEIKFEGIAETISDVVEITNSKFIDRIELVKDLSRGGLTPDIDLVDEVTKITNIPVYVMVRPHDNSFVYSEDEINEIKKLIEEIKKTKAKGIVFGSLTNDNKIDTNQLQEIINVSKPLKITFHRAIDNSKNYLESIEILNNYEIENILTSGSEDNAIEGIENIKKAIEVSKHNIMPGSGLSIKNINDFKSMNIDFLHFGNALKKDNKISIEKIKELKNMLN